MKQANVNECDASGARAKQVKLESNLGRSKTRIFWMILERLISQQFSIDLRIKIFFQNGFMHSAISFVNVVF